MTFQKKYEEILCHCCIIKELPESYLTFIRNRIEKEDGNLETWLDNFTKEERNILKNCMNSLETEDILKEDFRRIKELGIEKFPAFLVNNKVLITGYSYETKKLLDSLLED